MDFKKSLLWPVVVVMLMVAGCAGRQTFKTLDIPEDEMRAYLSNKPEVLKPAYRRLAEEGKRNVVLNRMRVGLDAYQLGYKDYATEAFAKALADIEVIYAGDKTAAKARSLWYEEGMKDFKGEPYERAMAYYYRGLLLLEKGDYENARAAFKSGVIQDAFAEEEQNRCDFALLIFLQGWASQMAGDSGLAKAAYKELRKLRPDFDVPSGSNVLIIIETGKSPRKLADGPGHGELKFRRGRNFSEKRVETSIDSSMFFGIYPLEDIFWQASSRGGRMVDKIVQGKASFRQTHEKIGTTLTDVSSAALLSSPLFGSSSEVQIAGAALGLIGVAEMVMAARARPHADTRYWDNLPDTVHMFPLTLPAGQHRIALRFRDENGNIAHDLSKELNFDVDGNKAKIIWIRSRQQLSIPNNS